MEREEEEKEFPRVVLLLPLFTVRFVRSDETRSLSDLVCRPRFRFPLFHQFRVVSYPLPLNFTAESLHGSLTGRNMNNPTNYPGI